MPASSCSSRSPSPPPPPLAPAAQRRARAASQAALEQEIANDKAVLGIWRRWLNPLKEDHGERWVEARWVEALAGFYRETGEAALETEGFFRRNGTTLALLREKYQAGPPDYVQPGFRSPHLGERFDLAGPLASLRALGWRLPSLSASSSASPPDPPMDSADAQWLQRRAGESSGRVDYCTPQAGRNAWEEAKDKVILIEFWASWCEGCVAAFPALSLLQRTYAPLLKVVSVNNPHVFAPNPRAPPVTPAQETEARHLEWKYLRRIFADAWAERPAEARGGTDETDGETELVDPLPFTIWEDPDGRVTEDVFRRVAVPFIPNAFLFIHGRLFWQGEPDLQDPAIGFAGAVTEAVEIVSGVREIPAWFREKMEEGEGEG